MPSKMVRVTIERDGSMCAIPVPFDAKATFGKVRAPVRVTIHGHTFRSTIASMGGRLFIPLRKSNREAAAVSGGETVEVRIELDTEARKVDLPKDLIAALKGSPPAWERWRELSFTHQREHVEAIEGAKKPETRTRRIENAVKAIASRAAKKR